MYGDDNSRYKQAVVYISVVNDILNCSGPEVRQERYVTNGVHTKMVENRDVVVVCYVGDKPRLMAYFHNRHTSDHLLMRFDTVWRLVGELVASRR